MSGGDNSKNLSLIKDALFGAIEEILDQGGGPGSGFTSRDTVARYDKATIDGRADLDALSVALIERLRVAGMVLLPSMPTPAMIKAAAEAHAVPSATGMPEYSLDDIVELTCTAAIKAGAVEGDKKPGIAPGMDESASEKAT